MDSAAPILQSLERLGLIRAGEQPTLTPVSGGVSCEVFRADLPGGPVCVKRPVERLRVAADWTAPTERATSEVAWFRLAAGVVGVTVPEVIAHDPSEPLLVMEWLEPASHPVWKAELAAGRVYPAFAAAVGRALGRIHARTAGDPAVAVAFDTAPLFNALRIDPFILTVARKHPDLAAPLEALAARTLAARIALVHGDVSPKNILVGPDGPVFLDAECAWYGDPAFDLAFVCTHLLLKTLWRPAYAPLYLASLEALRVAYFAEARFEPEAEIDRRAAALMPALLLARVDGKSPADYLTPENHAFIRTFVPSLIQAPARNLRDVVRAWSSALGGPGRRGGLAAVEA